MNEYVYIQSSHAVLEYDHARMFKDLGYAVFGDWDLGSQQRPKIKGITDTNSDINDFDFIILHQVIGYVDVMRDLLIKGKRVVLINLGQADALAYKEISTLCRDFPHAYVAPYSIKDFRRHKETGCPDHKSKLLYFGKYFDDFEPWTGINPIVYATCNSIHKRGYGCGWELMTQFQREVPITLSGGGTDEIGGMGSIPESLMYELLRDSTAFISFGTTPAALTLSQIEAWCAGIPTVIYDNGHGITEENLVLLLEKYTPTMVGHTMRLLTDPEFKELCHQNSLKNRERFDIKKIGPEWVEFITRILR